MFKLELPGMESVFSSNVRSGERTHHQPCTGNALTYWDILLHSENLLFLFFFWFLDTGFLFISPGFCGTYSIHQAGLKLTEIHLWKIVLTHQFLISFLLSVHNTSVRFPPVLLLKNSVSKFYRFSITFPSILLLFAIITHCSVHFVFLWQYLELHVQDQETSSGQFLKGYSGRVQHDKL